MIKKIVFTITTKSLYNLYKMQFITKIDGEWQIFDVGNALKYNASGATFDNLVVESANSINSTVTIRDAFMHGSNANFAGNNTITITFTKGIRVLQGIYYAASSTFCSNVKIDIYDENDIIIYADDSPDLKSGSSFNDLYLYKTPELEVMKVYPINTIGTIETNDNTQISNIYQIDSITVDQNTPDGTDIKYVLSFDDRNTHKTYKDGSWIDVDISNTSNIINQGLSKSELEALTATEFDNTLTSTKTLDVLSAMVTQNENVTPSISKIKVLYLRIV